KGAVDLAAELYDPVDGTFAATGLPASTNPRFGDDAICPVATVLQNGEVLVTWNSMQAELYDPVTGTFTPIGGMTSAAWSGGYTQTLLPNGKVLVAGGTSDFGTLDTAEEFDPATKRFSPTRGRMVARRADHTATLLRDGTVLLVGAQLPRWTVL